VADALNDDARAVRNARVLVLGAAYKKDVDDVRESPALDVIQLLEERGAKVQYHDPYVPSVRLENGHSMNSVSLDADLLHSMDCVVVVTNHSVFDYPWITANCRLLIDTRNATAALRVNGNNHGVRIIRL